MKKVDLVALNPENVRREVGKLGCLATSLLMVHDMTHVGIEIDVY